jgi:hypothetical protein
MAGDTVGCIEFVRVTRELTSITLRGRTVIFVLAIFTIFVVVALPPLGDAFSCSISTLKLFVTALFITTIASCRLRPLWKSAVFRAGNVVGDVGCHIFPLKLQIAESVTRSCAFSDVALKVGLSKCPIVTAWMKLTGLLTIQSRFLGIFTTSASVVTKICSVIFETRLFSYGHFFGWNCGGFISCIRRNGAIWPTITPFTLTSDVVTNLVN